MIRGDEVGGGRLVHASFVCARALLLDKVEQADAVAGHRSQHVKELRELVATALEHLAELGNTNLIKLAPVSANMHEVYVRFMALEG